MGLACRSGARTESSMYYDDCRNGRTATESRAFMCVLAGEQESGRGRRQGLAATPGGRPALGNGSRANSRWHTCRQHTWPSGRLYRPSARPDAGGPLGERGPATTGATRARRARAAGTGRDAALKACKQAGPQPSGALHTACGMPSRTALQWRSLPEKAGRRMVALIMLLLPAAPAALRVSQSLR